MIERREGGGGGGGVGGGRLEAKNRWGDGGPTGGGGRRAHGKGGDVIGACSDYELDGKVMSKAVLVRRELGQSCVVMT